MAEGGKGFGGARPKQKDYGKMEESQTTTPTTFAKLAQEIPEYTPGTLKREKARAEKKDTPKIPQNLVGLLRGSACSGIFSDVEEAEEELDVSIDVDNILGRGGFGVVYSGYKLYQKGKKPEWKPVAVKSVKFRFDDSDTGQRFQYLAQEVLFWEHLNMNPFVILLIQHFAVFDHYFFVMELAESDLTGIVKKWRGGMPAPAAGYFFRHLAQAVNYMHAKGIAHRDIKCDNCLIVYHGDIPMCKVNDFGLASIAWDHENGIRWENNGCGTTRYLPPEILYHKYGEPERLPKRPRMDARQVHSSVRPKGNIKPTTYQRKWQKLETLRPDSSKEYPKILQQREYKSPSKETFGLRMDCWALGVSLYVMLVGSYPFYTAKLPWGMDWIIRGKFPKIPSMSVQTREYLKTMLEPVPPKRATIKNILGHEWIRENALTRATRQDFEAPPMPDPESDSDARPGSPQQFRKTDSGGPRNIGGAPSGYVPHESGGSFAKWGEQLAQEPFPVAGKPESIEAPPFSPITPADHMKMKQQPAAVGAVAASAAEPASDRDRLMASATPFRERGLQQIQQPGWREQQAPLESGPAPAYSQTTPSGYAAAARQQSPSSTSTGSLAISHTIKTSSVSKTSSREQKPVAGPLGPMPSPTGAPRFEYTPFARLPGSSGSAADSGSQGQRGGSAPETSEGMPAGASGGRGSRRRSTSPRSGRRSRSPSPTRQRRSSPGRSSGRRSR